MILRDVGLAEIVRFFMAVRDRIDGRSDLKSRRRASLCSFRRDYWISNEGEGGSWVRRCGKNWTRFSVPSVASSTSLHHTSR